MTKARELREMSDEQVRLVWKDAAESLFHLRMKAQTEKLAAPSDIQKHRRTIARCQTIIAQRGGVVAPAAGPDGAPATPDLEATQQAKHAKKHRASGRAKIHVPGKGDVRTRRRFQKRTQSGE